MSKFGNSSQCLLCYQKNKNKNKNCSGLQQSTPICLSLRSETNLGKFCFRTQVRLRSTPWSSHFPWSNSYLGYVPLRKKLKEVCDRSRNTHIFKASSQNWTLSQASRWGRIPTPSGDIFCKVTRQRLWVCNGNTRKETGTLMPSTTLFYILFHKASRYWQRQCVSGTKRKC